MTDKKDNINIENKVASAILERPGASICLNGKEYRIAPPSLATLILVSETISAMPVMEKVDNDKITPAVLHNAKDFRALGDIAAILILGAKGLVEKRRRSIPRKGLSGLFAKQEETEETVDLKAEVSKAVLEEMTPSSMLNLIYTQLKYLEIGDFFVLTTSLSEANILKPTKEVED